MYRPRLTRLLIALTTLATAHGRSDDFAPRIEFPKAEPASVGVDPAALDKLCQVVQGYIDSDEAVGAELAVIKNGKMVLRRGFGLRDLMDKKPMETGGIFCIRSMTKTFAGTAIQMLIDDGKVKLDDRASKFLPAFDRDDKREITVAQLLAHRSGLPLSSSLLGHAVNECKSIQEVAGFAAETKLAFKPGEGFNYSDDGADTLTAIIEKASGMPADEFVLRRILQPLGLRDTMCVLDKADPRIARIVSNHMGAKGGWLRYWRPGDEPIFRCFLGSQSMYSSIDDYAALLSLWQHGGVVNGKRLLSKEAITRGHTPASFMEYPCGYSGLKVAYGQLWMLYIPEKTTSADLAQAHPLAFGHGGSDGTGAWVWPERDLMVLYFTQSRGGLSSLSIEKEIDRLLIRGDTAEPAASRPGYIDLLGMYWDAEADHYRMLLERDGKLTLEIPGAFMVAFVPGSERDEWKAELEASTTLTVERDASGRPIALLARTGSGESSHLKRFEPTSDLPSVEQVAKKVVAAHGIERISGVVRRSGELDLGPRGKGKITSLVTAKQSSMEIEVAGTTTRVVCDGTTASLKRGDQPTTDFSGHLLEQTILEQPQFVFGDWRKHCPDVRVIARVKRDGHPLLLIRAAPKTAFALAIYVDEQTGRVMRHDRISIASGLGALGATVSFDNFVEAGGAVLPKHTTAEYLSSLIGQTEITFDKVQVDAKIDPADFSLKP